MTMIDKIESFTKLWRVALPHIAAPTVQDAAHWCDSEPALVERAILRTGRRFAQGKLLPGFNSIEAFRYTSAVIRGEERLRAERNAL